MNPNPTRPKVVIVGLDGATWKVMDPLINQGRLPNIKALMDNGSYGTLRNVYPLESCPAWAIISTGLNPGKLGIFDIYDYETMDGVNATKYGNYTLWNILTSHNYTVCVDNVKDSYPPSHVKGFHISGKFAEEHEIEKEYYPPDLYTELSAMGLEHAGINRTLYLFEKYSDFDLYYVVFDEPDMSQHMYWHLIDPTHPLYNESEAALYGNVIYDKYEELDAAIGRMRAMAGSDTDFILLSDQGFGPLYGGLNMNKWLHKIGLLNLVEEPHYVSNPGDIVNTVMFQPENINWSSTKAYFPSSTGMGIFINRVGREPYGIVNESEYNATVGYIMNQLRTNLTDDKGRKYNVTYLATKYEIYSGPYLPIAQDIIFEIENDTWVGLPGTDFSRPIREDNQHRAVFTVSGYHQKEAVIIVSGPHFRKGHTINNVSLLDITPTVLALFNITPDDYVDGTPAEYLLVYPSHTGPLRTPDSNRAVIAPPPFALEPYPSQFGFWTGLYATCIWVRKGGR